MNIACNSWTLRMVFVLFCLCTSWPLRAQDESALIVVVVAESEPSVFARRLAAEIRSIGYAVQIVVAASVDNSSSAAASMIREYRAVAIVACPPTPVDPPVVWIETRDGTDPKAYRISTDTTDPATGLAIRTAEILYAALMKIESEPPAETMAASPSVLVAAAPEHASLSLYGPLRFSIAVGGLFSPGLLSPSVGGLASVAFIPRHRVGFSWLVVFPLTPARFMDDSGSLSLWSLLSGPGLTVSILPPVCRWRATVGVGAGAQLSWGRGIAAADTVGVSETERTAAFWLHLSLSRILTRTLSIRVDFFSSFAMPPLKIETPLHSTPFAFPWLGIMAGIAFGSPPRHP